MSVYPPPIQNYSRYNPLNFIQETTSLTIADGDTRYLRLAGGIVSGGTTFTSTLTNTNRTYLADGDAKNPALTLSSSTGTGLYKVGTNGIAITTNGSQNTHFHTTYQESFNPIRLQNGSKTAPSITFTGDTDTGLYKDTTNGVAISTDGSERLYINSTKMEPFQAIHEIDVTITTPAYSFKNSTNSGFYLNSGANPTITRNGLNMLECQNGQTLLSNTSTVLSSGRYLTSQIGTAAIPTFQYFDGVNNNNGIFFKASTYEPSISHNGSLIADFGSNITLSKPLISTFQTCLSWKRTTTQSITANTPTILDFPTADMKYEIADITYSSSPIKYTINKAGRYLICYEVNMSGDTSDRFVYSWIEINGAGRYSYSLNTLRGATGNNYSVISSSIFDLAATNTINVVLYNSAFTMLSPYGTTYNNYLKFYRLS